LRAQKELPQDETGRIVQFPTGDALAKRKLRSRHDDSATHESYVRDLRTYERGAEPDDYARRMIINIIAFAFIVTLTLAGIWIADQMASLSRHQDCVLSGRNNCADIDAIVHKKDVTP
jgi:hypothetical protein